MEFACVQADRTLMNRSYVVAGVLVLDGLHVDTRHAPVGGIDERLADDVHPRRPEPWHDVHPLGHLNGLPSHVDPVVTLAQARCTFDHVGRKPYRANQNARVGPARLAPEIRTRLFFIIVY